MTWYELAWTFGANYERPIGEQKVEITDIYDSSLADTGIIHTWESTFIHFIHPSIGFLSEILNNVQTWNVFFFNPFF